MIELVLGVAYRPDVDTASLVIRVVMGAFFMLYRFRWFWDPSQPDPWFSHYRKERLASTLRECGYPPQLAPIVAVGEVLAGLGLILGLLTLPSALAIIVIMIFANKCTPRAEIRQMKPVDCVDWFACYLRLVEPLYLSMAFVVLMLGPGRYSLDHLIMEAIR